MNQDKVRTLRQAGDARRVDGFGPDPDDGKELSFPWRLNDGRSGVTHELCNAIRCAAHDGRTYSEIKDLFGSIGNRSTARQHAVGECRHEGGVLPIPPTRTRGDNPSAIRAGACRKLRGLWSAGEFDTYDEAANWADAAHSTTYRHINGRCSHD